MTFTEHRFYSFAFDLYFSFLCHDPFDLLLDVFIGLFGLIFSACPLYGLTLLETFLWHVWSSMLWAEHGRCDCVDGYVAHVWQALWGKYDLYGCNVIKSRFQKDQPLRIFIKLHNNFSLCDIYNFSKKKIIFG